MGPTQIQYKALVFSIYFNLLATSKLLDGSFDWPSQAESFHSKNAIEWNAFNVLSVLGARSSVFHSVFGWCLHLLCYNATTEIDALHFISIHRLHSIAFRPQWKMEWQTIIYHLNNWRAHLTVDTSTPRNRNILLAPKRVCFFHHVP